MLQPRLWVGMLLFLGETGCPETSPDKEDTAPICAGYRDNDGDGYGDPHQRTSDCPLPSGWVEDDSDCDDENPDRHPGASEVCNEVDDDCDGLIDGNDQGVTGALVWCADDDGDGYGDALRTRLACQESPGFVGDCADCNDGNPAVHPGHEEVCNAVDDDCDGLLDGQDPDVVDAFTWYPDTDGDGYGNAGQSSRACSRPQGWTADGTDCDDGDGRIHPNAVELASDGVDGNCDGLDDPVAGWLLTLHQYSVAFDSTHGERTILPVLGGREGICAAADADNDGLVVAYDYLEHELITVDPCSGAINVIAAPNSGKICGLAWGPGGLLYALDEENDHLSVIDPDTAAVRIIGDLGFDLGPCDMAYDATSGVLYGIHSGWLFTVDPETASVLEVPAEPEINATGAAFDPASGVLYVADHYALYTLDPDSLTPSLINLVNSTSIDELSWFMGCGG